MISSVFELRKCGLPEVGKWPDCLYLAQRNVRQGFNNPGSEKGIVADERACWAVDCAAYWHLRIQSRVKVNWDYKRLIQEFEEGFQDFQRTRRKEDASGKEAPNDVTTKADFDPVAIVVSCADSPYPVEAILGKDYGSLWVISNLGNRIVGELVSQIRVVLRDYRCRMILVLGHEDCKAVKHMSHYQAGGEISESLAGYLGSARDEINAVSPVETQGDFGITLAEKNVVAGVERLKASKLPDSMRICGAVVDLSSAGGLIRFYE